MWINPATLQILMTHSDIRAAFPNVSLPADLTEQIVASIGVMAVQNAPKPAFNRLTERVVEGKPLLTDGIWTQQWEIVPLTDDEQAEAARLIQFEIVQATQQRLDDFARTRNYDSVDSIAKYKDIADEEILLLPADEQPLVEKFRNECRYLALSTARTWAKLYLVLDEILAGTRPMPSGYADIEPELPVLEWPQ